MMAWISKMCGRSVNQGFGESKLSTAADGDDDLNMGAGFDQGFRVPTLGHDLAILLDRDALAGKAQLFEQARNANAGSKPAGFTVEGKFDHDWKF